MKILLLLISAALAFVAGGISADWSIFDLDNPALNNDVPAYGWLAVMCASLGLVVDDLRAAVRGWSR